MLSTAAVAVFVGVLTWKLWVCNGMTSDIDDVVKVLAERLQVRHDVDYCYQWNLLLFMVT